MRTPAFPLHDAGALALANAVNNAVALALTLAAAALLPAAQFGALGLALAIVVVVATLADWGLGIAVLRLTDGGAGAARVVLTWKAALALCLVAVAAMAPPPALDPWPVAFDRALLVAALLSAGLLGCWGSARVLDQAREDFVALRRATLACAALRLLAFAALGALHEINPVTLLACLYVAPLATLLALRAVTLGEKPRRAQVALPALLRAAAWPGLSALCFVAFTRAPVLLPGAAASGEQLGVHSGALALVLGCGLLGDAARAVLLPRILRAHTLAERTAVRALLWDRLLPVMLVGTAGFAGVTALYASVLGLPYAAGAPMALIMGVATLATAWLGLHSALLHALRKPELEAAVNAGRLLALAALLQVLPAGALTLAASYAGVLVLGELVLVGCAHALDRGFALRPAASAAP